MMSLLGRPVLLAAVVALALQACATGDVGVPKTPAPMTAAGAEPDPVVVVEEEPPQQVPPTVPEPEPPPLPQRDPEPADEPYVAPPDVYAVTFDELQQRIREWSAAIARKDYDMWYGSLSRSFLEERGNAEYLAELSGSRRLRDRSIVLRTLRDYFSDVVVPARVDAALDRIDFVGENAVKAYAEIGGDWAILYHVVREDGVWKIGTSCEQDTALAGRAAE
jgi:hypothetical protein